MHCSYAPPPCFRTWHHIFLLPSHPTAARLLAENDQLKTRLARAGLGEPVAAGSFAKKDE